MNTFDDLQRFDLVDRLRHYGRLPVRELAQLVGIAPQLVYYRIRTKKLQKHICPGCGKEGMIDYESARDVFPVLAEIEAAAEEAEDTG